MEEICRGDILGIYNLLNYIIVQAALFKEFKLVVHLPLPPILNVGTANHCDTLHSESDSQREQTCREDI